MGDSSLPTTVRRALFICVGTLMLTAPAAHGASDAERTLEEAMPSEAALARLKERIGREPDNLDHCFAYAQMARALRQPREAAWAYERMVQADPSLMRVKLELAMVYVEVGRYNEAIALFEEVLASRPPVNVEQNIRKVLAALEERRKNNIFGGSFSVGFNWDTNANAGPDSGNVTIVDTSIPLGAGAGQETDLHAFTAFSLNHTYRGDLVEGKRRWQWNSSALLYGTEQDALDDLNIRLYSLRTGPELFFPESQSRVAATASVAQIDLDGFDYLQNRKLEMTFETAMPPHLLLAYMPSYEYRNYINSEINTTYHDRSGDALQHSFSVKRPISEKALLEAVVALRYEHALQQYYANHQSITSLNYTRMLSDDLFLMSSAGYKLSKYDQPDLLISSRTREDNEYSLSLTLGKKLNTEVTGDLIMSGGYQFRDVQSNIENYEYENHRVSMSVTKNF